MPWLRIFVQTFVVAVQEQDRVPLTGLYRWDAEVRAAYGDLLHASARYHLYFLLVTMQMYALFPVLRWVLRKTAGHHVALFAAVCAYQLALTAALQHYPVLTVARSVVRIVRTDDPEREPVIVRRALDQEQGVGVSGRRRRRERVIDLEVTDGRHRNASKGRTT